MKVVRCSWSLPTGTKKALNGPHTKILKQKNKKTKKNKKQKQKQKEGILLMVLNNGVMQGSHGHGRVGFSWMCVQS